MGINWKKLVVKSRIAAFYPITVTFRKKRGDSSVIDHDRAIVLKEKDIFWYYFHKEKIRLRAPPLSTVYQRRKGGEHIDVYSDGRGNYDFVTFKVKERRLEPMEQDTKLEMINTIAEKERKHANPSWMVKYAPLIMVSAAVGCAIIFWAIAPTYSAALTGAAQITAGAMQQQAEGIGERVGRVLIEYLTNLTSG